MLIHKQGHKSRVTSVRPTCLSIGRAPVASLASPPWPSPSQCTSECTCVLSRVGWGFSCPALCRVATLRAQSPRARHLRGRIQPISLSITTLYRESDGARGQLGGDDTHPRGCARFTNSRQNMRTVLCASTTLAGVRLCFCSCVLVLAIYWSLVSPCGLC